MVTLPVKRIGKYDIVSNEAVEMLKTNGTYLPNVKHVIFNLQTTERIAVLDGNGEQKTETVVGKDGETRKDKFGNPVVRKVWEEKKLANPILATTVFWADGTVTRVKNSPEDPVSVEEKKLSDGSVVTVASVSAKAQAIAYATTKRTCGLPDEKGEISGTGMGRIIDEIIGSAYDQNLETAKSKVQKAAAKAKYEARKAKAGEPKPKRYTYDDCLQIAGPLLEALAAKIGKDPSVVEKLIKAVKGA